MSITYNVSLKTTYGGAGYVFGTYNLALVDSSGAQSIGTDSLLDVTQDKSFQGAKVNLNITVPAERLGTPQSDTVYLKASVMGTAAVPEPTSVILLAIGMAALMRMGIKGVGEIKRARNLSYGA